MDREYIRWAWSQLDGMGKFRLIRYTLASGALAVTALVAAVWALSWALSALASAAYHVIWRLREWR